MILPTIKLLPLPFIKHVKTKAVLTKFLHAVTRLGGITVMSVYEGFLKFFEAFEGFCQQYCRMLLVRRRACIHE